MAARTTGTPDQPAVLAAEPQAPEVGVAQAAAPPAVAPAAVAPAAVAPPAVAPRTGPGAWVIGGGIAALTLAVVLAVLGAVLVAQDRVSGTAALVAGLLGVPGVALLVFGAVLLATEVTVPRAGDEPAPTVDFAGQLSEITRSGTPSRTLLTFGAGLLLAAVLLVMLIDGVVTIGGIAR